MHSAIKRVKRGRKWRATRIRTRAAVRGISLAEERDEATHSAVTRRCLD